MRWLKSFKIHVCLLNFQITPMIDSSTDGRTPLERPRKLLLKQNGS